MHHVRVCRDCGEEFRPEIARCSDCGGELVDEHEDLEAVSPEAAGREPARNGVESRGGLQVLTVAERAAELEPLARELGSAGIPFAVQVKGHSFALLVGEQDVAAAEERLGPLVGRAAERSTEPAVGCPACGGDLPEGAGECPGCGLYLGDPSAR